MDRTDYGLMTLLMGITAANIRTTKAKQAAQRKWDALSKEEQDALIEEQDRRTANMRAHQAKEQERREAKWDMRAAAKAAGMTNKAYKRWHKRQTGHV